MEQSLNIYRLHDGSHALGPGLRYLIWVQGCMQHCKGCITPQGRSLKVNQLIRIDALAENIIQNQSIEGITISGGEPFLQASKLTILLQKVKEKRPELNVIVFTGYTLDQLDSVIAQRFIQYIDLLIDGPYVDELNDEKGLRGSSNQRLHFLTNKLLPYQDEIENGGRNNEIFVGTNGTYIIGIPNIHTSNSVLTF